MGVERKKRAWAVVCVNRTQTQLTHRNFSGRINDIFSNIIDDSAWVFSLLSFSFWPGNNIKIQAKEKERRENKFLSHLYGPTPNTLKLLTVCGVWAKRWGKGINCLGFTSKAAAIGLNPNNIPFLLLYNNKPAACESGYAYHMPAYLFFSSILLASPSKM